MQSSLEPFRLPDEFILPYFETAVPWGPVGYVTYKRTYARPLDSTPERIAALAALQGIVGTEEWPLTVTRVIEGMYYYQQLHCAKYNLPWDNNKAVRSAKEAFDRLFNFKWLPPGRGLWMMGTDYVRKNGGAALNNCFHSSTRFWANGELISFRDAANTEQTEVEVLAKDGQWRSAKVREYGTQPLYKFWFKPKGIRSNHEFCYTATANHRWFLSSGEVTTSLDIDDCVLVKPAEINKLNDKEYTTGFAHGLIFGDGTRHTYYPERHFIRLCGRKNWRYAPLLESVDGYVSTRTIKDSDDFVITIVRKGENWKQIPDGKSFVYQSGFLDGWLAADGSFKDTGSAQLNSINYSALDWAIERAPLLGYTVVGDNLDSSIETNLGKRSQKIRRVTFRPEPMEYKVVAKEYYGEDTVYCVEEPETNSFTLEGGVVTGNCAFVSTSDLSRSFADAFTFCMDMSMLGVGVGFDTLGAGQVRIEYPSRSGHYRVSDSREGWTDLIRTCLDAYVGRGSFPSEVDYAAIRPKGSPIRSFGGTSSGAEPLERLVNDIQEILDPLVGQTITTTAIADLFNAIGRCVVSGNVRRSAEIALGPATDEFLSLKDPSGERMSKWGWASNNSVVEPDRYDAIAERIAANGEPGIFWLTNARRYGRMKDEENWDDERACGTNPCSEQTLESRELCCLVETFPSLHETPQDFYRTLKFAYLYAKTVTCIPTHDSRTNAVMLRNRRIGCSQSGVTEALAKHGPRGYFNLFCDKGYDWVEHYDDVYSDWLCVPRSIKVTSVKPSGSVSKLPGVSEGIHFPISEHYWQVIRFASDSPYLPNLRRSGYRLVELDNEPNTTAVYFPCKVRNYSKSRADASMWEQLELTAQMQYWWADNQVSSTVTFKESEARDIATALSMYESRLKGISLLPLQDHGYVHAPQQSMSPEEYEEAVANLEPLDLKEGTKHEVTDEYCDGDSCLVEYD